MELHHFNKIHEGMGIKRANINPGVMAAGKLHTYFDLFVCMGTLRSFQFKTHFNLRSRYTDISTYMQVGSVYCMLFLKRIQNKRSKK